MKRPLLLVGLFALVAALVTGACGDTIRPPAATVNGNDISEAALDAELDAIIGNPRYLASIEQGGTTVRGNRKPGDDPTVSVRQTGADVLDLRFVGRVLTRQIFLQLVHEELLRRKLSVTRADLERGRAEVVESVGGQEVFDEFPAAYRATLLRRTAEVSKLQAELSNIDINDQAIKAFYDQNPELFAQTCVSHILFTVIGAGGQPDAAAVEGESDRLKRDAEAAKARIDAGADFAATARELSADTSNKEAGGDLECGPPGRFVPEFETAMEALAVNQVSAPVQTQFGWHLIKVTGRTPQPLEEAEPQIRQRLQADSQQAFSDFLEEAVAAAKVTVNPRYGSFSKGPPSPGIVAPGAPTTTEAGAPPAAGEGVPNPLGP